MRSFIEDGYTFVRKVNDGNVYIVSKTGEGNDGYGIPKAEDPTCIYSYTEAETYWNDNPDKRYDYTEPEPTAAELLKIEALQLKQYLDSTDYAAVKCYDRGLVFADEYPELYAARQAARDRINEIENQEDT